MMSEKIDFNRSTTVNFYNNTSLTLNLTGHNCQGDSILHNVPPPGAIQPGQQVQWIQKVSALEWYDNQYASYGFSGGSLKVEWSNPISSGNTYSVSCDPPSDYNITYTGGSGQEATINVYFVQLKFNGLTYRPMFNVKYQKYLTCADGFVLTLEGSNDNPNMLPGSQLWAIADASGQNDAVLDGNGTTVKLINHATQTYVTLLRGLDNILVGNPEQDSPDQRWQAQYWDNPSGWLFMATNRVGDAWSDITGGDNQGVVMSADCSGCPEQLFNIFRQYP
jgi:hypothetical protein